jgi:ribosome-associated protein
MAKVAMQAALDRKAGDVIALDMRQVSLVADYFVLASGTSTIHTQAIARHVMEKMAEAGYPLYRTEGLASALWILLDYGAVVVHVFREEERRFYNLERLWGDAEVRTL